MTHKNDLNFNAKLNGKEKFGFRKLSAGLAAVALGTTFFLSSGQLVHADETSAINKLLLKLKTQLKVLINKLLKQKQQIQMTVANQLILLKLKLQ